MIRSSFMVSDYYGLESVPGPGSGWTEGGDSIC
jgi:hypothetical protein